MITFPFGNSIPEIKNKLLYLYSLVFLTLKNKLYVFNESNAGRENSSVSSIGHWLGRALYSLYTSFELQLIKTKKNKERMALLIIFLGISFSSFFIFLTVFSTLWLVKTR